MKKILFTLTVFGLAVSAVFCQNTETMTEFPDTESEKTDLKGYQIYYFHENLYDSEIFTRDSFSLYDKTENPEFSKLELYGNLNFCLFYNIKIREVTKENEETGEIFTTTVMNSDELLGRYDLLLVSDSENSRGKARSIRFILNDGRIYDFEITEKNNKLILVKK